MKGGTYTVHIMRDEGCVGVICVFFSWNDKRPIK